LGNRQGRSLLEGVFHFESSRPVDCVDDQVAGGNDADTDGMAEPFWLAADYAQRQGSMRVTGPVSCIGATFSRAKGVPSAPAPFASGDRRSERVEAHAPLILGLPERAPDITLSELRGELAEVGVPVGIATLWRFFARRRITLKKSRRTRPAAASDRSTAPPQPSLSTCPRARQTCATAPAGTMAPSTARSPRYAPAPAS
jgi:hypothetical protein